MKDKNRQNAFQTEYKSNPIPFHFLFRIFFFLFILFRQILFLRYCLRYITFRGPIHLSDVRGTKFMVQNSFDSSYFFCSYERNEYDIFQIEIGESQ